jgi:hypothetical protein
VFYIGFAEKISDRSGRCAFFLSVNTALYYFLLGFDEHEAKVLVKLDFATS